MRVIKHLDFIHFDYRYFHLCSNNEFKMGIFHRLDMVYTQFSEVCKVEEPLAQATDKSLLAVVSAAKIVNANIQVDKSQTSPLYKP